MLAHCGEVVDARSLHPDQLPAEEHLEPLAREVIESEDYDEGSYASGVLGDLVKRSLRDLERAWPSPLDRGVLDRLAKSAETVTRQTYDGILREQLPAVENALDDYYASQPVGDISVAILDLLHPAIIESSYSHFRAGHYREAVLNAFVTVFELIRRRTSLDKDGAALIGQVFSLENPLLVFDTLESESGRNQQKGYIQILQGAYLAIRNPNAHSSSSTVDRQEAAQCLVFASFLSRKVERCSE